MMLLKCRKSVPELRCLGGAKDAKDGVKRDKPTPRERSLPRRGRRLKKTMAGSEKLAEGLWQECGGDPQLETVNGK